MKRCVLRTALVVLFAVALSLPAAAQVIDLKAELKGGNEVPPLNVPGAGQVAATYDPAARKLSWRGTLADLSGPPTMAHFHGPAEAGKNAGIVLPIPNPGASFASEATLTEGQARDMLAGLWYVNIHTAAHPAGEVRGQLRK